MSARREKVISLMKACQVYCYAFSKGYRSTHADSWQPLKIFVNLISLEADH